jgi:hypothetical protein
MIRLGLSGPQLAGSRLSDDVDPGLCGPPIRPPSTARLCRTGLDIEERRKNRWQSHSKSPPNAVPLASRRIFASMYSKDPSFVAGRGVAILELIEARTSDSQEII